MFIKAVRNDYSNQDGTEKYEVGKEYKGFHYYFTNDKSIGVIAEVPGYERGNLLETRFLEIDPVESPYDTGFGHFTSKHIKVIREIPTVEVREIFEKHGFLGWFKYAEEEVKKSKDKKSKEKKVSYKSLLSFFKLR